MRLLQLVPALEQGGVERGVVELNRAFVARGWENHVVSAGGRLANQIAADGGVVHTLNIKSKNPFTYFSRVKMLRALLEEVKPDVVCAHSRVPAWLFVAANRELNIPWISFAHGANSISRYSRVMTRGDLVVTPSQYVADYLMEAYSTPKEKIRVIPRAIEAARFDPEKLDEAFVAEKRREWGTDSGYVVMALGRITQLKGYDILIRALSLLDDDIKLIIVGEAEKKRRKVETDLKKLVAELELTDRVIFAGNQSKVAECLSLADVVVSSNVKKPEAFGRSMAEALAMGRPVVARAFGGALDVVRDGKDGILIKGNETSNWPWLFAEAIRKSRIMDFEDMRTDALERFSFDKMVAASVAVYEELVKGK